MLSYTVRWRGMDLGDGSDVPKGEEFGRGGGKGEMQAWERVGQGIRYTDGKNARF